jgi:ornithine cyclodeaminase/alanine dehydrogenase-like protein (mu-crystallin family)
MNATLLLSRADVARLLTPRAAIEAIEDAFRQHALGAVPAPGILGMHAADGSFHVKAGFLGAYFAAKINANFPGNSALPTIQGAVVLFDAVNGRPLAIMDSISITAIRTAAASAVAAKYLARPDCDTALICGCGGQAVSQLEALLCVHNPRRIFAYDRDANRTAAFAARFAGRVTPADDLAEAARSSDIIVTCTTASRFFITPEMIRPGAFVAAVGADNEHKQEIDPRLLAQAKVVTDLTDQAARIGDLHHAIDAGVMSAADVHAQLGEVIAGRKPGRERPDEIIVFDSTGTGLQDVAAAIAVYEEAGMKGALPTFALAGATALSAHGQTEGFDTTKPGSLPPGWECGVTGKGTPRWSVQADPTAPSAPQVLQQSGSGTFPWCVKKDASLADGYVEVKFKPMQGKQDQAGGVVWRWKDGDNYYVARANALENNVSLYYTEKGRRITLKYVDAPVPAQTWNTLAVEFSGTRIRVALNGKVCIELDDAHIRGAGAVGLWTKADSLTAFDDFSYAAQ